MGYFLFFPWIFYSFVSCFCLSLCLFITVQITENCLSQAGKSLQDVISEFVTKMNNRQIGEQDLCLKLIKKDYKCTHTSLSPFAHLSWNRSQVIWVWYDTFILTCHLHPPNQQMCFHMLMCM